MKKLLLLHERFRADDVDLWRIAIRRGWNTERTNRFKIQDHLKGADFVRYYGNTLHVEMIREFLPIDLSPIDYKKLAECLEFTKRKIDFIRFETLAQPLVQNAFIKPAREKWFEAKVWRVGETILGTPLADDEIYVSEITPFTHEVRCFVLDGEVQTSSYYIIDGKVWDTTDLKPDEINFDQQIQDTPIPGMCRAIYAKGGLPRGVVMDFGYTSNREWALIEFNEAWASGLYYCDYEKCFDVIIESQKSK